ncbi:MAG TPA: hypothetical protein VGA67_02040 [Candidatus Dojkabacteria bacterium]|jgi:hypothetical protein
MNTEYLSQDAQDVIKAYTELNLGLKKVKAPYYMNLRGQKGGLRVMIGKGTPDEIEQEVKVWSQVKGFDIEKADEGKIREFMVNMDIGIDCSGFSVYVLNAELKAMGLKSIWNYLQFDNNSILARIKRIVRPIESIGANMLTNENNCIEITDFNDIKPSDLIRAKGKQKNASHVAIVTEVTRDADGNTKSFKYAHSHRYYEEENGLRIGKVEITDPAKELKEQKWIDDKDGRNYMLEDLLVEYEDNGLRRLNIFDRIFTE